MIVYKKWGAIILVVLFIFGVFQTCKNISQGNFFIPTNLVKEPTNWKTFKSNIKPFQIEYPSGWIARDLPDGNHGDVEIIALISSLSPSGPIIELAYREIPNATLEQVSDWGIERITTSTDIEWAVSSPQQIQANDNEQVFLKTFQYNNGYKPVCYQTYFFNQDDAYILQMCMNKYNKSSELEKIYDHMIRNISFK